jgi:hypothetical protein
MCKLNIIPLQKHKKSKNQQKKAARIQQTIREALIYGANKVSANSFIGEGSLIPVEALTYCCNGRDLYQISACSSSTGLNKKQKDEVFALVETNLKVCTLLKHPIWSFFFFFFLNFKLNCA